MTVDRQRGDTFIVQHEGRFYLIDFYSEKVRDAHPPDKPDEFLRAGYFEDVGAIGKPTREHLEEILANHLQP